MTVHRHATTAFFTATFLSLVIIAIAFAVRAFDLAAPSLWYDEGYTVMFAQRSWPDLVTQAAALELNTPLHYVALKAWMAFAGTSEFSTRLLSVFWGVLTVALAHRLSCKVLQTLPPSARSAGTLTSAQGVQDRRAQSGALFAVLFVALSPVCVMVSREVRMYAQMTCLCTLSVVLFVQALQSNKRSQWIAWAIASLAAFGSHVLAAFMVGAVIVWLLFIVVIRRGNGAAPRATLRVGLVTAATVALIMIVCAGVILPSGATYGTSYRDRLNFFDILLQSLAAQLLPRLQPESLVLPAALGVAAALVLILIRELASSRRAETLSLWFIGVFSLIAIAAFCALTGKFSSRYPAIVTPLILTSAGAALAFDASDSRTRRFALTTVGGAASLAMLFGLAQTRVNPIYANEDFRGAAAHIRENAESDEAVLLVSGHVAPVFEYYFGSQGWTALPDDPVLNVNHTLDYASAVPPTNGALKDKNGAWLLLWQDDVIDPTSIAPSLLKRQSQGLGPALDSYEFHGLRVQRYRFFRPYQTLPEQLPLTRSRIEGDGMQQGLNSLGCYQFELPRAGGLMEVACLWQIKPFVPLDPYMKVSLRLFDPTGAQVLQSDQAIAARGLPSTPFDKPITAFYVLQLPADLPAGDYTLRAIPYTESREAAPQVVTPIRVLP